jgi:hypothetical protein
MIPAIKFVLTWLIIFLLNSLPGQAQYIHKYDLLGKWHVIKITENDQDIALEMDRQASRWVEFFNDGVFASDGYPFGNYSGEYNLDEQSGLLSLKNDINRHEIIQWLVTYDGDQLIIKGTGKLSVYTFYLDRQF